MKSARLGLIALAVSLSLISFAGNDAAKQIAALKNKGMTELGAFPMLQDLTGRIGARLSGSPEAAKAVEWGKLQMEKLGLQNIRLVPCMVPHWVRGDKEELAIVGPDGSESKLNCCSLGMSVGTDPAGVSAEIVEVHSLDEAQKLGGAAAGKIVFFNGPFDPTLTNTFAAYGGAAGQRFVGAAVAGKLGAVGAIVRSMTLDHDDVPHTGAMGYGDSPKKVPAVAVSLIAADTLHDALQKSPVKVHLTTNCQTLPDEPSANVIGEIVGSERPNEVIDLGGHLDSWDKGKGAHDDGAGIAQGLEALRLLKQLGLKPTRTIRVVLWMNEENGGRGSKAYLDWVKKSGEKHIAAIESDSGGFAPRGFGVSVKAKHTRKLDSWLPFFRDLEIDHFTPEGEGGSDIDPLAAVKTVLFGLEPESQRYFDYHHSIKDTIDKVNPRELELGAVSLASLAWMISEEGL